VYKVVVVDKSGAEFDGVSEIVGLSTLADANRIAEREAYDTAEVLLGDWQVVRESMSGGKYGARLEPTTGAKGYIVVMVSEQ
jgi:hypothetical protein